MCTDKENIKVDTDLILDMREINGSVFSKINALFRRKEAWFFIATSIIIITMGLTAFIVFNLRSTQVSQEQIIALTHQADQLVTRYNMQEQIITDLQQRIYTLQQTNDSIKKVVVNNAYTKAHNVPDSELANAFNELLDSARKRNAARRLAISADN